MTSRERQLASSGAVRVEVVRAHGEVFGTIRPATAVVEVSALIDPALLVEVEADAVVPTP